MLKFMRTYVINVLETNERGNFLMDTSYYSTSDMMSMAALSGAMATYSIVIIAFYVLLIIAQWKIFTKAGEAGWKSLIPIYNAVILFKISGLSPWLLLLVLLSWIPVVGTLITLGLVIVSMIKLGKSFGRSTGFIVGLILLPSIFELILGFGSAQYVGPAKD